MAKMKLDKASEPKVKTAVCPECHGCGWTCSNCGKPAKTCECSNTEQEAIDCQTCEGEGTLEIEG